MKLFSALLVATSIAALAQPVSAKSIWEQLAESAPRAEHPFDQIEMTAPRSNVFTELETRAPRSDMFDELNNTAP
jgi:hypothetical protein